MSDSEASNSNLSNMLNNIYRCEDKSNWYSEVAQAYERTRPRYPAKILARLQEIAQLHSAKAMLEIGTGPGIASVEFAKMGVQMICLEPSLPACKLAQQKCAAYPNVQFINTTFEEWELTNQKFDVVVATTSFHWLTSGIRTQKTAAALKKDGLLILLWNTPPQPSYEVYQILKEIYQTHAPELDKYETLANYQENLGKMGQEVIDSGYFKDLTEEHLISKVNYSIDDYLTLLSTLSPYIRLQREQRNSLFGELRQILQLNFDNQLELTYLSLMQTAHKS